MKLIKTEKTKNLAACKSGMDEKTARKYIRSKELPSQQKMNTHGESVRIPLKTYGVTSGVILRQILVLMARPCFFIFNENIQEDFLMVNFGHYKEG